jgi:hypothetical protein
MAGASAGTMTGPPLVVLADPLTVERLARAASLALLSIAIVGDEAPLTDAYAETSPSAEPSG